MGSFTGRGSPWLVDVVSDTRPRNLSRSRPFGCSSPNLSFESAASLFHLLLLLDACSSHSHASYTRSTRRDGGALKICDFLRIIKWEDIVVYTRIMSVFHLCFNDATVGTSPLLITLIHSNILASFIMTFLTK